MSTFTLIVVGVFVVLGIVALVGIAFFPEDGSF